ncbi:DUF898 family protein [Corynebacterium sphenisci]|uniref:DUF898 family protein n=1 Tax=Corynebacterium sphenisci TaxID=191493 RepID=UPI0026E048F8|nr:DUF898 family protein [Corynebacterium sphenisci]MDO5730656.1 hypothetical protein [Corynebacterium sphenisci]
MGVNPHRPAPGGHPEYDFGGGRPVDPFAAPPPAAAPAPSGPVMPPPVPGAPMYRFTGGAGGWLVNAVAGVLITTLTLGLGAPWATVLLEGWKARNTYLFGHRLRFTGTGMGLFGQWVKWWLLIIVTLGVYGFWVAPRYTAWIVEHRAYDDPRLAG